MTKRDLAEFLQDILDAISDIEAFTSEVEFEDFRNNREKIFAIVKLIEILGEAVKQVPNEIRAQYPEISWQSIAGMQDVLVHQYWGIDVNVVWATIQEGLPPLKAVVIEICLRLRNSSIE